MVAAQQPGDDDDQDDGRRSPVAARRDGEDETGQSPDLAERSPMAQPLPIYSNQAADED